MRRRLLLANSHAESGGGEGDFPHNLVLTHGQQDDVSLAFYNWGVDKYWEDFNNGGGLVDISSYNITITTREGATFVPNYLSIYRESLILYSDVENYLVASINSEGLCNFYIED